jgi:Family of unknown function (DUF6318)
VSTRHCVAATIAAAVVASGALSGCSDDEAEPPDSGLPAKSELTESTQTSTPPSVTGPSSSDPTRSGREEPPLPAAAKAPGKAGARAFVAYYIRLLNYASWTGDTTALRARGRGCGGCVDYARLFEKTYQNGGWFKGGAWAPVPRTWFIASSGNRFFLAVHVNAAKGLQRPRRGADVTRFLADRYRLNFLLAPHGESWRMKTLGTPE